ncbi:hypothetical protein GCM10009721_13620 [Terrabacter tumescens]|uniref:Uncharacterized protein n=1 Tax=Terrabacter tumescens TaxID=60443 RepID=A0ABQ2HTU9_9MICO|nr:hypothetical protein [Terrabacter tumescens]GGM89595.1 hypothetical protein GCM10009721_13620 [Terrabacter tumescens]
MRSGGRRLPVERVGLPTDGYAAVVVRPTAEQLRVAVLLADRMADRVADRVPDAETPRPATEEGMAGRGVRERVRRNGIVDDPTATPE